MESNQKPARINILNSTGLITFAAISDLTAFLLAWIGLDWLVSWGAWLIFTFWFFLLGVGFLNAKRLATVVSSLVLGSIPVIGGFIPELTVGIIMVILITRAEDKLGIKLPGVGLKK